MYGRQPKIPLDLFSHNVSIDLALTTDEYASNFEKLMKKTYACVSNNRTLKMEKAKIRHDRQVRAAAFKKHEHVWLSNEATKVGINKKLMKRWKGPYLIHDLIGEVNYIIKPVDKKGRKTTVHRNRLKRCYLRTKIDTGTNQPLIKIEEEEGVSVEDTTKATSSKSKKTATSNTEISQQTPTEIVLQENLEPRKVLRRSSRISKVTNRFNPTVY
jgi:hypothetical protein